MPSRPRKQVVHEIKNHAKNPHAVALSKLGASKGGKARAANLTPEERRDAARKAAEARWRKPAT